MFYLVDEEGTVFESTTLNDLMKEAEQSAYGPLESWDIFDGKKIQVECVYQIKAEPKPAAKKAPAKPAVKK